MRGGLKANLIFVLILLPAVPPAVVIDCTLEAGQERPVERERPSGLLQEQRQGENPADQERAYLERARRERPDSAGLGSVKRGQTLGLTPITEMGEGLYKGQTGGLYGRGANAPEEAHLKMAALETAKIEPLDAEGRPSRKGKIVLMAIGMSNTKMEFSAFMDLAAAEPNKSENVVVVNAAIGGMDVVAWAQSRATQWGAADDR